jgi:predicted glycosyltransferase
MLDDLNIRADLRARPFTPLRPCLLFYCQHSLGIGHLTRSFSLAAALSEYFHVVFLNGGRLPPGLPVPATIQLIDLPALGMDDGHTLISRDAKHDVAQAQIQRRALIEAAVLRHKPAVLLVELFPFGRKKFTGEILPLIRLVRHQSNRRAVVACSLRDILVDARPDQQHHDDRACWLANRYFDCILIHADASLARLEECFHPRKTLHVPVHYTGYVLPGREASNKPRRGKHLLVSAGGGIVGYELFRITLQAHALLKEKPPLRIIAGPFLPEAEWQALLQMADRMTDVKVLRHVPDMVSEMRRARASISQCGYNTAMDILVAQVPALVVPYSTKTENEQSQRASRLAALGTLRQMPPSTLDPQHLANEIAALMDFKPRTAALEQDGAVRSAQQLHLLCERSAFAAFSRRQNA